ncbi:putative ankyrin repeat protein RF_0381 [Haliotis asinina]|uniref:putative ankyrin repeat protein RF_0381 n=1 Tax=Haliotis asinina TaxID=109174 RepID=UPI00353258BF
MGDLIGVRNILLHGWENINSMGKGHMTPVMHAAKDGNREMFDLLVKEGADLSLVDVGDRNILHLACIGGNLQIVKYVLAQKIGDINTRDMNGRTPVLHAASAGHKDVFDVLVEAGAHLSLLDGDKETILHVACEGGNVEIIKHLLKQDFVDIDTRDISGWTPVMYGARHGHKNVFDVLVDKGADLSLVGRHKTNILHFACVGGNVEIIKYLLKYNIVDIDSRLDKGWTPIMQGASEGHKNVFDVLVKAGADLSLVAGNKETILHVACEGGNVEIIKYLLTQGIVDIDNQDSNGRTPVMQAATFGQNDAFDLLVEAGANLSLVDYDEETIFQLSCEGGNVDIIKYVLAHENVDINGRDGSGLTTVMYAVISEQDDVYDLLVKWGADLSLLDKDNNNILHLACGGDNVEIVRHLLTHNIVDINSRNGEDRTPAMIAARCGHEAIFFLLADHVADLTVVNGDGDNILTMACEGENVRIVKYVSTRHIVEGSYREDDPCDALNRFQTTP